MELSLGNKEITIDFPEYGATVTCSPLSTKEIEILEKRHTKTTRRGSATETQTNVVAMGEERFTKTVIEWTGITNNGKKLECNLANKKKIYQHHMSLVGRIFEELEAAQDEEMGNSQNTSSSETGN